MLVEYRKNIYKMRKRRLIQLYIIYIIIIKNYFSFRKNRVFSKDWASIKNFF